MVRITYYGEPTTKHQHIKRLLEKELVKRDVDVQWMEVQDPALFTKDDINSVPAVMINKDVLLSLDSFSDEGTYVRAVVSQVLKTTRIKPLVVVPVDFSETAANAFEYALQFASKIGAGIKLVHVFTPVSTTAGEGMAYIDTRLEQDRRTQWCDLVELWSKNYQHAVAALNQELQNEFLVGDASREITRIGSRPDTKMIILGSTGAGNTMKNLFGSVSIHVSLHAKCPVLIIPPDIKFRLIDQLLFASDSPGL